MGETSATGVASPANPSTGAKSFYGESWSTRRARMVVPASHAQNITERQGLAALSDKPSMETVMPEVFRRIPRVRNCWSAITAHAGMAFTVERGKLGCCRRAAASVPRRRP